MYEERLAALDAEPPQSGDDVVPVARGPVGGGVTMAGEPSGRADGAPTDCLPSGLRMIDQRSFSQVRLGIPK